MFPKSFQKLIDYFAALPSIGPKMAERLVLFLFKKDKNFLNGFSETLAQFKDEIGSCKRCYNIAQGELCDICKDTKRDQKTICVIEEPLDVIAIEKTQKYNGLYHVLGGLIDTSRENKNLRIAELLQRAKKENTKEIILALNPTTEGDATSFYIIGKLKPLGLKISKLARGLSTGGDIEYADEITLSEALLNRREIKK